MEHLGNLTVFTTMVVHNPNNWHWVDKNCLPWTKTYLDEKVVDTLVENEGITYTLTQVDSVTGDCDVTQRKGKVLCIYDMQLKFAVKVLKQEEESSASISIPEFVHDQDEDEYVFEIEAENHKPEIRKHLVPALKSKLMKFQQDLILAHEKDVQHTT